MSDGQRHAATSAVTRDETRFDEGAPGVTRDETRFNEGALTFDTHGSSASDFGQCPLNKGCTTSSEASLAVWRCRLRRQLRQMARRQRADSTTPLSELCPANEVAVAMEFGPEAEFLVNATGLSGDGHTDCG